jgi:lipoprotein-releasing system permease protein
LVYINLSDARRLFIKGHLLRGFHIKLDSPYMAPMVANQLRRSLPISSTVSDWTDQFGAFFKALSMEKTMMFFILLLIVAVAAFNLVSSLVMLVHEKRADIAILRTLGMQPLRIMWIFIFQGALIGFFGMLLGVGLGIFVSLNAPHFVDWLQQLLHVQLISASVYFVNYLPVSIHLKDVLWVGGLAWLMGILATIYPAILAFKTSPAEVLRRE